MSTGVIPSFMPVVIGTGVFHPQSAYRDVIQRFAALTPSVRVADQPRVALDPSGDGAWVPVEVFVPLQVLGSHCCSWCHRPVTLERVETEEDVAEPPLCAVCGHALVPLRDVEVVSLRDPVVRESVVRDH